MHKEPPEKEKFLQTFFARMLRLAVIHPFWPFIRKHIISNKKNLIPCCKLQTSRMKKLVFLHMEYSRIWLVDGYIQVARRLWKSTTCIKLDHIEKLFMGYKAVMLSNCLSFSYKGTFGINRSGIFFTMIIPFSIQYGAFLFLSKYFLHLPTRNYSFLSFL